MRKFDSCALAIAIILLVGTPSSSVQLSDLPVIPNSGYWSVRRSVDAMTDKPICVGFYKDRFDIQLSDAELYISLEGRGGVSLVTLRFDDKPAKPSRLASEIERDISAVKISGSDFQELFPSKRLRAQIYTILDTIVNEDLDLTGLKEAHSVILSPQCQE